MKCIILDDERKAIVTLHRLIENHCTGLEVVGFSQDVAGGIELIKSHQPDLVFLDVEMTRETGFDLLNLEGERNFHVIVVSAYSQYAIRAFKFQVHDYLLKPVMLDELLASLGRLEHKLVESGFQKTKSIQTNLVLAVPASDGHLLVKQSEIVRLKGDGAYTQIFTIHGKVYTASYHLAYFEKQLNPGIFLRCHKSHIINIQCILKVFRTGGCAVEMLDQARVDVSRTFKSLFDERIKERAHAFG